MAAAALCDGLLSRQPPEHLPGFANAVPGAARPAERLARRAGPCSAAAAAAADKPGSDMHAPP